jgi:hypothetical protein
MRWVSVGRFLPVLGRPTLGSCIRVHEKAGQCQEWYFIQVLALPERPPLPPSPFLNERCSVGPKLMQRLVAQQKARSTTPDLGGERGRPLDCRNLPCTTPMNAGRRATVRGPAARVLRSGATKLPDESFNITVAMALAVLYELSHILTSQTPQHPGRGDYGSLSIQVPIPAPSVPS